MSVCLHKYMFMYVGGSGDVHNDVTITSLITLTVASSASQAFSHTASLGSFKTLSCENQAAGGCVPSDLQCYGRTASTAEP